ncbi:MAG: sulfatase [Thermoanaerobaculia bacterium]
MKRALAGLLLLPLLLAGCGRRDAHRANVLFILVDTLRADRLSLYGYGRATSPNLEALAREGVVFTQARSPAGCTFPSVNSLLTSRTPATFLLQPGGTMGIAGPVRPLPEILREHGYATAAVSASPIVRRTPSRVNPTGGFGRGFQTFDESCFRRHARCLNERAAGLLETLPRPWFLYLHYMEPHAPYQPGGDHRRRFARSPAEARARGVQRWAREGEAYPVSRRIYDNDARWTFTPQDLAHLSDLYDEEIAYFDEQLAGLLGLLRERRLEEDTLIVFAADHGEEMYEHRQYGHCRSLAYETVLRTPLVLRIPGAKPGLRRDELVDNLDVVPTLLDYLGLPIPPLDGASLRSVIETGRPLHRYAFGNQGTSRTITDGIHKLHFDLATGRSSLFDLRADPGEIRDLAAQRPAEARRLQATLLRWLEAHEGPAGRSRQRAAEIEKQLRALGYL